MTTRTKAKPLTTKYRPSLSALQILTILDTFKRKSPSLTEEDISIIATLSVYKTKIENDCIAPSYVTAPSKPNLLDSLMQSSTPADIPSASAPTPNTKSTLLDSTANKLTKLEMWEAAYAKYSIDPGLCSLQELKDAQEHRYLNDLMTQEEVKAFEDSQV